MKGELVARDPARLGQLQEGRVHGLRSKHEATHDGMRLPYSRRRHETFCHSLVRLDGLSSQR
jgi:hypothetical protein